MYVLRGWARLRQRRPDTPPPRLSKTRFLRRKGGRHPTTTWVPGEVVVDAYEIPIRADAPPGAHVIEVGMYDPGTLQRLSVLDPTGAVGDRILLGDVQVVADY